MEFDPKTCRRNLKTLGLKIEYEISVEKAAEQTALGSWGVSMLDTAMECFLVGFFSDAKELIAKAKHFLQLANLRKEQSQVEVGSVFHGLALSNWFLNRETDLDSLRLCVDLKEAWFAAQRQKPDKVNVQLSLLPYLEADSYQLLMARYESAGLKKPANIRRIKGEGTMCYVMARHRLGLEYHEDEIAAALETFLQRTVKEWLGRYGAFSTAARWMKIAHWQRDDDPVATLLRCYDYLPDLKAPKYPPREKNMR
jgi:hypothetical protein